MNPEPLPFIGTERVKSLKASPKNLLKNGSSSNGNGDTERFCVFSTSIFTTAIDEFFTIGTIGLLCLGNAANALPDTARTSASVSVNAKNFLLLKIFTSID